MLSPDLQRIEHILDYCLDVETAVSRHHADFSEFENNLEFQTALRFVPGRGLFKPITHTDNSQIQPRHPGPGSLCERMYYFFFFSKPRKPFRGDF